MAENQGEYKIRLTTEANLKGVTDLNKALDSAAQKAKTIPTVGPGGKVIPGTSPSSPSTPGGTPSTPGSPTGPSGPGGAIPQAAEIERSSSALLGLVKRFVGYAAVIQTVRKAIHEYVQDEQAVAALDATLAQRAQLTDKYRESLAKLADEYEARTGIDSADWINSIATLTKFGAGPENIEKMTKAVEDLAGVMGGDINTAATAIGKAMNGSTQALTRFGFTVDETKSRTEQLNSLFEQFAARGGGQLENRAKTLSGEFGKLMGSIGNLGSALVGLYANTGYGQLLFQKLATSVNAMAEMIGTSIAPVDGLTNALHDAGAASDEMESSTNKTTTALDKIKKAADNAADALDREKDALSDVSEHTVKMIEATAKLEIAKVKANTGLTDQQKAVRVAGLEAKKERDVFAERQRLDTALVVGETAAKNKLAADEKKRGDELAALEAKKKKFDEASQARADANRKRQLANDFGMDDYRSDQWISKGDVSSQGLNPQELEVYRQETQAQKDKMEREAAAAEAKAASMSQFSSEGGSDVNFEIQKKKAELEAIKEKNDEARKKLQRDIENRQRGFQSRAGVFGVDRQAQAVEAGVNIRNAGGGPPEVTMGPAELIRQHNTELAQITSDVVAALRARDIESAKAFQSILSALNAPPAQLREVQKAIDRLERQNATRPPGGQ